MGIDTEELTVVLRLIAKAIRENNPKLLEDVADKLNKEVVPLEKILNRVGRRRRYW